MSRQRPGIQLRRLRRVLLVGVIVFVGGLAGLYLFGRRPTADLPAPVGGDEAPAGTIVAIGNDFHYEVSEDGVKLWEIDADRLISDDQGRYVLEGVVMTAQRDDGSSYGIAADRGEYQLEKNEAQLSGNVVLTGSRGLTMKTEGLELIRGGRIVVSSAPVEFAFADSYEGRANRFEVHFGRDRITLAGKVRIATLEGSYPAASIEGRRILFFRKTHNLIAEGAPLVTVRHEQDSLAARRISLNFDENDDKILFALASWQVQAFFRQLDNDGVPASAVVAGDKLSVVFEEGTGDPQRFEMDAPKGGTARLTSTDATGLMRGMQADYLWADFSGGRVRAAQGHGGVVLEERLSHAPEILVSQVCSESAEALYDAAGEVSRLELIDAVSLMEPRVQAGGDRLTSSGADGVVELLGDSAWMANHQGRLEAPRIEIDRAAREVRALEGVRAELADDSSPDLESGEDPTGPVRVQAQSAVWTDEPRQFEFQEDVRAWQGENFLVSQTLGVVDGNLLASGNVRSVWHKRTPAAPIDVPDIEPGTEPAVEEPPVQISSTDMRYERDLGRLIYEGQAKVVQGPKSMACPRLQLQVDDNDDFERMYCEAGTQIDDGVAGNRITGDTAVYNNTVGKVKILGEPVRLNQADGGSISARLMVYDFDTGIAEIDSVKAEEAELYMSATQYFAEKQAAVAAALLEAGGEIEGSTEDGEGGDPAVEEEPPPTATAPPSADDVGDASGGEGR